VGSPPSSPALRARYERRRADVVAAAARVFAQRGYHATSIDDLIVATGLTRGGLYHYTDSKQALLFAIFDELMEPLLSRAREIVEQPGTPERHLRALTHAWVAHIATHLDHMVVFTQERGTLERDPRWQHLRAARRAFEQLLAGVLRRGQEDGSFVMRDPQLTLLTLLGMVNYTPQWFSPRGRLTPEQIADGYCDVLLDGTRPRS
jgi:AcrR family transcriptional regulator